MSKERISLPGDPALDIDVSGVVLQEVVRLGGEVILKGAGGSGRWLDSDGIPADLVEINDFEVVFGVEMKPGHHPALDEMIERLESWMNAAVPLRFVSAPGKWAVLFNPVTGKAVPIPRSVT